VGFRKAEIQTLVSSRATSGTTFCLDLGSRSRDLCFDNLLRNRLGANLHSAEQALEVLPPLRLWIHGEKHARLVFQSDRPQRPQHAVLEHRPKSFPHWNNLLGTLLPKHPSGALALRSSNVDPDGFRVGHKMLMFQWQDGKKVIVWPEELAPGKARFPTPPWSQRP